MEIGQAWAENYYVIKANILHERVHNPDRNYSLRGKKVLTALDIFNDSPEYDICGKTDCLECTPSKSGVVLRDGKRYALRLVEYKPTMPKSGGYNEDDLLQVFAQKLCIDGMFHCDCDATIYYQDKKKRIDLPLSEEYQEYAAKIRQMLVEMRAYRTAGKIPGRQKGQRCNGCSLRDLCMPSAKQPKNVRARIDAMMKENGV